VRPPKFVRRWYAGHDMNVVSEDWGRRDPTTGEGLENVGNTYWGDRADRVTLLPMRDLERLLGEKLGPIWSPRTDEERKFIEALEDFFTPYIALLPKEKASVLDQYLGQRRTQEQIASAAGVSQQAVSKQLRAAARALMRRIAEDWPENELDPERPSSEQRAWFVFQAYWYDRFGRRFNG